MQKVERDFAGRFTRPAVFLPPPHQAAREPRLAAERVERTQRDSKQLCCLRPGQQISSSLTSTGTVYSSTINKASHFTMAIMSVRSPSDRYNLGTAVVTFHNAEPYDLSEGDRIEFAGVMQTIDVAPTRRSPTSSPGHQARPSTSSTCAATPSRCSASTIADRLGGPSLQAEDGQPADVLRP
jgi:hypothetical protein